MLLSPLWPKMHFAFSWQCYLPFFILCVSTGGLDQCLAAVQRRLCVPSGPLQSGFFCADGHFPGWRSCDGAAAPVVEVACNCDRGRGPRPTGQGGDDCLRGLPEVQAPKRPGSRELPCQSQIRPEWQLKRRKHGLLQPRWRGPGEQRQAGKDQPQYPLLWQLHLWGGGWGVEESNHHQKCNHAET